MVSSEESGGSEGLGVGQEGAEILTFDCYPKKYYLVGLGWFVWVGGVWGWLGGFGLVGGGVGSGGGEDGERMVRGSG